MFFALPSNSDASETAQPPASAATDGPSCTVAGGSGLAGRRPNLRLVFSWLRGQGD